MSKPIKEAQFVVPGMAWMLPVAMAGVAVVTVITYIRSEEKHAASGSPLYGRAVQEAIEGLKNPGAKTVAGRPPLAAGLSPDEYSWCEQCKAYHKRQSGQGQAAGVAGTVPANPVAGQAAAGTIPPLPAGLSPDDYNWCANCKAYHKRQPDGATPPPGSVDHPGASAAGQAGGVIPPLPAGFSAADYYWCAHCKAYHKRQPDAALPAGGAPPKPPPVTPAAPAAPGAAPATPSAVLETATPVAPPPALPASGAGRP